MNDTQLEPLVRDVANAMSAYSESWSLMLGPGQRGFGVDMVSHKGEHVNFQDSMTGGYPRPRLWIEFIDPLTARSVAKPISVANSRPPLAIAREIVSRLLPGAREELASRRAKEAKAKADFEARAAVVNQAERMFGEPSDFGHLSPEVRGAMTYKTEARLNLRGRHLAGSHAHDEFGRVSVTEDGSLVSLELSSIPADVLLRMLAVLAEHNAAQRKARRAC